MNSEGEGLVSDMTRRNWARLGADETNKLTARANKRLSGRQIIPTEYVLHEGTLSLLKEISEKVSENGWEIVSVMYSLCAGHLERCGRWERGCSAEPLPIRGSILEGIWQGGKQHKCRNRKTGDELPQSASLTAPSERESFGSTAIDIFSEDVRLIDEMYSLTLPEGEWDILGLIYQTLLTEGAKNRAGAYYTPSAVVRDMIKGLPYKNGQTFLDPCCGSGSYILGLVRMGVPPGQIFACDIDPIAVMIARTNLLCECREEEVIAHIVCADFLKDELAFPEHFDCVITNPPWGAMRRGESFAEFLHKGCEKMGEKGVLRFLLPDSFLNIRAHRAVRRHLLEKECITQIRLYEERFGGVTTGCICVEVRHQRAEADIQIIGRGMDICLSADEILRDEDCIFSLLDDTDRRIFEKVQARGVHTLKDSLWALGIVTGDNKKCLKTEAGEGDEPIYTGREVRQYRLSAPRCYIRYDRDVLQQSAKEEYYRAAEKLIYKFISNRPVFALDISGALCLNSANILIPRIPDLSIRTVMALLNSELYQYLYMKWFADVKILKGNLQKLPFPALSEAENEEIDACVREILGGNEAPDKMLQGKIFALFGLTQEEAERVRQVVGNTGQRKDGK